MVLLMVLKPLSLSTFSEKGREEKGKARDFGSSDPALYHILNGWLTDDFSQFVFRFSRPARGD